jgi:hypothetical protein
MTAPTVHMPRTAGMSRPGHFGCWAEPVASGLGPNFSQHCSSVYSFFEFIFHLIFLGNSFKEKIIENEIELRKI